MRRINLVLGTVLVAGVIVLGLVSLVWTPFDPTLVVPADRLLPPGWPHVLGTDAFGIDVFSRIMAGARVVVQVGLVAVGLALVVGVPLGVIAAMTGRWLSDVIMRAADILYAFPALLLAILLAAAVGASTMTAAIAIGVASVPAFARIARAATLQVTSSDYMLAARAAGTSPLASAVTHVLPNIAAVIWVQASVSFGMAILAEAGLSYLGLATPPPAPTWGRMLRDAQNVIFSNPEQALWPGLAIALAVLGFNLLGDGLRDQLDPRLRDIS